MSVNGLFSPTKQALQTALSSGKHVLQSPSKQPLSPCRSNVCRRSVSPCSARRCLSALQTRSSSGPLLPGNHPLGGSSSLYRCMDGTACSIASSSAASLPVPSPGTPAAALAAASPSSSVPKTLQQQQQHAQWLAASSTLHSPRSTLRATELPAIQNVVTQHTPSASLGSVSASADVSADQMPSPRDILQSPPEVECDNTFNRQHQPDQAPQGIRSRPAMSGWRVTRRFDVPLGLDWLANVPDHAAELGSGRLDIIMGPMFAGKTTELIKRVHEASKDGQISVVVKSSKDARYGCHWVVTHDGRCMRCFTADTLQQFKELMGPHYHKLQVLAVDEAQFFPDLSEFCRHAVDHEGKHVIVAGLSGDSDRQKFGQLLDLMPLADDVKKLRSKCGFCDQDALFSVRLVDTGPQALVGGDDKYRAACRRCYLTHKHTTMQ